MRIGIDISQTAFAATGVSNYLSNLVTAMLEADDKNKYILFFTSLRGDINPEFKLKLKELMKKNKKIKLVKAKIPPSVLDVMWNKLHMMQLETFVGRVDVFLTSDWTEPPAGHAKKVSILYDLIIYKHPEETALSIIETQKRKLNWAIKETDLFLCISEATKKDAMEILKLPEEKFKVIYPGLTL